MQQQNPLEDSEDLSDSQQDGNGQGGDGDHEEEDEESVNNLSDLNRSAKRKSPEVEEVTKPQSRKKTKALEDKNLDEGVTVMLEELEQALDKSTETLTQKWSQFTDVHLAALTGVANSVSELKEFATKSATNTATSSTPASTQQDMRQWPTRDNMGQVPSAALILTDPDSRPQMSMTVGIDYTKLSMTKLHLS